jgi:hypothetical protein
MYAFWCQFSGRLRHTGKNTSRADRNSGGHHYRNIGRAFFRLALEKKKTGIDDRYLFNNFLYGNSQPLSYKGRS